jgi:hypothetical protein
MKRFYISRVEKISMSSFGSLNLSGIALSSSDSGSSMIALNSGGMLSSASKASFLSYSMFFF